MPAAPDVPALVPPPGSCPARARHHVGRGSLVVLLAACLGLSTGSAGPARAADSQGARGPTGQTSSTASADTPHRRLEYAAPVPGTPAFARPFRAPAQRWSAGHRGLDLWLDAGTPVLAPAAGTVTFAGTVVDRGFVSVLHPDGRRTSVEPVDPRVVVGEQVEAGAVLGTLQPGGAHCPPRDCLHWGLRDGDGYLDPLSVLSAVPGAGPVVLLPSDASG